MNKSIKVLPIKWESEKRKLSELEPWEPNPRKANKKERDDLQVSLERFNLAEPIIINKDGTIIGGHFRYSILQEKGLEQETDVRVPNRLLTQDELIELNLRLNKNRGEWDIDRLLNFNEDVLEKVGFTEFDLPNIEKDIDDIRTKKSLDDLPDSKKTLDKDKYHWVWVEFETKEQMETVKACLGKEGKGRELDPKKFLKMVDKYKPIQTDAEEENK